VTGTTDPEPTGTGPSGAAEEPTGTGGEGGSFAGGESDVTSTGRHRLSGGGTPRLRSAAPPPGAATWPQSALDTVEPDKPAESAEPVEIDLDNAPVVHKGPGLVTLVLGRLGDWAWRGARAGRRWAGEPGPRLALTGLATLVAVAVTLVAGWFLVPSLSGESRSGAVVSPEPTLGPGETAAPEPGGAPPPQVTGTPTAPPQARTGSRPADGLQGWAQSMTAKVGDIPLIALEAYGYAELYVQQTQPNCHLTWTTLAGIGKVESNHGQSGGATLGNDGRPSKPILGDPLDGQGGRKVIPDTDKGALDGDKIYDRAVGPMQFLPSTWQTWQIDADRDGRADINDIDDAALAAGNYLCANQRDLSTAGGWWQAVASYNAPITYGQRVFEAADLYGQRSRT